jgi:hypothetical protein
MSGRNESIQVVIHLCMEAMVGICIAIFISTNKNVLSFLLLPYLLFNKIGEKGRTGSSWKGWGQEEGNREEKWPERCMHI